MIVAFFGALALTYLLYNSGLSGPFLLDDEVNIRPDWVSIDSWEGLLRAVAGNTSGTLGRPLSTLSLIATGYLSGYDPHAYKLTNLYIHLLNGVLLFWFLTRLISHVFPSRYGTRETFGTAFALFVMALWLLHPLNVSTTLYAVQRMAQLSTLFILLTLITYLYAREQLSEGRHAGYWLLFGVVPFCMALAVLSKENGALTAPLLLLTEAIIRSTRNRQAGHGIKAVNTALFLFGSFPLMLGAAYLATHWQHYEQTYSLRRFGLEERLLTELHVVLGYMKELLVPRLSEMSLYQDDKEIIRSLGLTEIALIIFYVVLIAGAWIGRRRHPLVAFGILWFFIGHALESTFLPLELAFEHRNYLPSMGLFVAIVALGVLLIRKLPGLRFRWAGATGAILYLSFFTALTGIRADTWGNEALFRRLAMDRQALSPRLIPYRARARLNVNDPEGAIRMLEEGARLEPERAGYFLSIALIHCMDPHSDAKAMDWALDQAISRLGSFAASPYDVTGLKKVEEFVWDKKCKHLDAKAYLRLTSAALSHPQPYEAALRYLHGIALYLNQRPEEALAELRRSYGLAEMANKAKVLDSMANIQLETGDTKGLKETISTNYTLPVWWRSPHLRMVNGKESHHERIPEPQG